MAAQDLERLVVQLSADIKKYENAMNRATGVTNRQLGAIQKKADYEQRRLVTWPDVAGEPINPWREAA